MWSTDKSADGVLQYLSANHEQVFCRLQTITYVRMAIVSLKKRAVPIGLKEFHAWFTKFRLDINPCRRSPCQHGARCENDGTKYHCHCVPGYKGAHCEHGRVKLTLASLGRCCKEYWSFSRRWYESLEALVLNLSYAIAYAIMNSMENLRFDKESYFNVLVFYALFDKRNRKHFPRVLSNVI